MKKLLLIDSNSLLYRAFYAIPSLTNSQGIFTNGVFGFFNMFFKFLEEEKPDQVICCFDHPSPTIRHDWLPEYKGSRAETPDELKPQFSILKNVLQAMEITICEKEGYEADDLLGTLAAVGEENNMAVTIISGDKDLLQIASEHTKIRIPTTSRGETTVEDFYAADVMKKYGVTPTEWIDVKALMGDKSDDVPGVPAIGEKTALKLIQTYHNLDSVMDNVDKIPGKQVPQNLIEYRDQAYLSQQLVTIIRNVEVDCHDENWHIENMFNQAAYTMMKELELSSFYKYFEPTQSDISHMDTYQIIKETMIHPTVDIILKAATMSFTFIRDEDILYGLALSTGDTSYFFENTGISTKDFLLNFQLLWQSNLPKIAFDHKKDILLLEALDIYITDVIFDCQVAMYVIDPRLGDSDIAMLAQSQLNESILSFREFFGKGKTKKAPLDIHPEELMAFACDNARVLFKLHQQLASTIKEQDQDYVFWDIEMPLIDTLAQMESFGIKVNTKGLDNFGKELSENLEILTGEIIELAGEPFNINSPKQMGEILFEKLKLPGSKRTKSGFSTAASVLEELKDEHDIVAKILDYRTKQKLYSTYVEGLQNAMTQEDLIKTTFHQTVTLTGRLSSADPNLQNIPIRTPLGRELRRVFIPSQANYLFVDADYSQIELRILAHMSGDETFISAFREGADIHSFTASQVLQIPIDKLTPRERDQAKAINFGIVYGISAFSLAKDLGVTVPEAQIFIDNYFARYPKVKEYLDASITTAKELGYALTIYNRRRYIPELSSRNFNLRSFGERVAMNMPIQGTAADIIKIAMNKVSHRLKKESMKSRLLLQVHDELLLEAPMEEVDMAKTILIEEMQGAVSLDVPIVVDINVGSTWLFE